jgi:hypothetical protein
MRIKGIWAAAFGLAVLAGQATAADIARKVQVVYDPVSRSVSRVSVGVVDPQPQLALGFLWEPDAGNWPGVDAEGLATGPGTLTWLVPGAASYDPRAVHDRWVGGMAAGAYDGAGVLTRRDGSRWQGTWRAGLIEGEGSWRDADGNLYEGTFRAGLPEGHGTLRSREGWIYEGGFQAGQRHGAGRITLPGGQVYEVVMERGAEISSTRPAEIADSTLGGLLRAQGGGDAGKVGISVVVEPRITSQQSVQYENYLGADAIEVYAADPSDPALTAIWNGGNEPTLPFSFFDSTRQDWLETRAFLSIEAATADGSKVKFDKLRLAVASSMPHLRPMLNAVSHYGCIGTRPDFHFENYGWGPVANPRLRVRFAGPDEGEAALKLADRPSTRWFDVPVAGFDQGGDVDLTGALTAAGVDLATLSGNRFTCPTREMEETCAANLRASVSFGEVDEFLSGYLGLSVTAIAELTYDWTDAAGRRATLTETYAPTISLARIEVPDLMAEMGAGGPYAAQAPQFQEIKLQDSAADYAIDLPIRGNPTTARVTAGVQLWAERSSIHQMTVEASFADGSIRRSKPIWLFYLSPRKPEFTSGIRTGACYLSTDY